MRFLLNNTFNQWARMEYSHIKPGLERIKNFFRLISREKDISGEEGLPIIHISGTNGKGSVASYLASILKHSGIKTGLYTSPHLLSPFERIKLDGENIPEPHFEKLFKKYSKPIRESQLTFFEMMTALAIIYFCDKNSDISIMEVGVGGKLDATNICQNKLLSIITSISKDHTDLFGNEIRKIAAEDVGIIKENTPVVCGKLDKNISHLVSKYAHSKNSPIYFYSRDFSSQNIISDWKNCIQRFDYVEENNTCKIKNIKIQLMGGYQTINCSVAIKSALLLMNLKRKFSILNKINLQSIQDGVFHTHWPGRFQIIKINGKTIIIDGAHNEEAVQNFTKEYLKSPFSRMKTRVIFGCLKEKDHTAMAKYISQISDELIITRTHSPRTQKISALKDSFIREIKSNTTRLNIKNIKTAPNLKSALAQSPNDDKNTVTLIIGSLYLVAEALKITN